MDETKQQKETNKKDFWDILSSLSVLISGVLISAIGLFATTSYNNRQLESQRKQADRELSVQRIQTIQSFFSYLSLDKKDVKTSALVSIAALDEELAIDLSVVSGDEAGALALTALSRSPNKLTVDEALSGLASLAVSAYEEQVKSISMDTLSRVFNKHRDSIVEISLYGPGSSWNPSNPGIIITRSGIVWTQGDRAREAKNFLVAISSTPPKVYHAVFLGSTNGSVFLELQTDWYAGLRDFTKPEIEYAPSEEATQFPFLEIEDTPLDEVKQVIVLFPDNNVLVGRILSYDQEIIQTDLPYSGRNGLPAISTKGKLVGLTFYYEGAITMPLLNASLVKEILESQHK